jgi:DNA-binding CsgD family transcriptional regulator
MTEPNARTALVRRNVAAAVEGVLDARGQVRTLRRIFEHSRVPMVMASGRGRFVDVNHPARRWFRLSRVEMRTFAIGDRTPAHPGGVMEQAWSRLLDAGSASGTYPVCASDGSRVDLLYRGVAHIMPGLHLIAFAPADWPVSEFPEITDGGPGSSAALTPREIEVLALAADGFNGPDVAQELSISHATVRTHLANIYEKLGVGNRAAAVAKGMRLGLIE